MTCSISSGTSAWEEPKAVALYRDRIACKTIHFIDGNHDGTTRKVQHLFASWSSLSEVRVGKQGIVLCHYAMKVWPHQSRGTWQLYGHSHGNLPDDPLSLSMDVGVDRGRSVATRLTEAEFSQVEAAASGAGKKVAEWLRDAALAQARGNQVAEETDQILLAELMGMRSLMLNLFARASQGPLSTEDIKKMSAYSESIKEQRAADFLARRRQQKPAKESNDEP